MVQVAEDISREVIKRAEAVRRNRDAIVGSLGNNEKQPQPKCCPLEHLNFTVDSRFPGLVTTETSRLSNLDDLGRFDFYTMHKNV